MSQLENNWQVGKTILSFNGIDVPAQLLIFRFMKCVDRFYIEGAEKIIFTRTDPERKGLLTQTVSTESGGKEIYFYVENMFINWRKPFMNEFLSVFLLGFVVTSALASAHPSLDRYREKEEQHYKLLMEAIALMFRFDPEFWVLRFRLKEMVGVRALVDGLYCSPSRIEKEVMGQELFIFVMLLFASLRLLLNPEGLSIFPLILPAAVLALGLFFFQEYLGVVTGGFLILYGVRHLYGDLATVAIYYAIILCGIWFIATFRKKAVVEKEPPLNL